MRYFEPNVAMTIQIVFSANLHSHIVNSAEGVILSEFKNPSFRLSPAIYLLNLATAGRTQ